MKNSKFPVFIGPYTGKITGQNLMFVLATQTFENPLIIDTAQSRLKSIIENFVRIVININSINIVYITVSRSKFGFLRDLLYCIIFLIIKKPMIAHLHGSDLKEMYDNENFIIRFLMQYYYSSFSCFIGCIPEMKNEFSFLKKNIEYIHIRNAHEN